MRRFAAFVFVLGSLGLSALPSATAGAASGEPGRYIVVLKDSVSDPGAVAQQHGRAHQAGVSHVYRSALKGYAATIPANRLDDVRSDPRVAYVEADKVAFALGKPGGSVPKPTVQTRPPGITAVGAYEADTVAGDGSGEAVGHLYVIDTGVDSAHPDLNVVEFKNFAGGPNKDCNGHGTHVAGTAAARDNTSHVVGVAPGVSIHAIKVLNCNGSGFYSGIIAGIDWVTENHHEGAVANMSLGGPADAALDAAVQRSADRGVLYVVSAGNESQNACNGSPARAGAGTNNGIVTVGAVDASRVQASFSNHGPCVDIWAPGVSIISTWPGSTMRTLSGTSMASPHVAGGGLLLRSGATLTPAAAEARLKSDADDTDSLRPFLDVRTY